MCHKVVTEDQVEDAKFAKKKLKKSAFSTCTLIAVSKPLDKNLKPTASLIAVSILLWYIELFGFAKINNVKKLIIYSFETRIEIRLNQYLKDIIGHLLEGFLEREKHFVYTARVL